MNIYVITWFDIMVSLGWIIFAFIIAFFIYERKRNKTGYKNFFPHFFWKIGVAVFFAIIYTTVYGGDTTAYFEGALTLKKLMFTNPSAFITELLSTPATDGVPSYFNGETGAPPLWIYHEANSWFVSKITSFVSIFTFNSFLCTSLLFSMISGIIVWRFYIFLVDNTDIDPKYLAIAVLFFPTVAFWCSGIMKDTVVLAALIAMVQAILSIIFAGRINLKNFLIIIICCYLIISTRSFVLFSVLVSVGVYAVFNIQKSSSFVTKLLVRSMGIGATIAGLILFFGYSDFLGEYSSENIIKTAEITYNDFQHNQTYLGKRYDLGITEYTGASMIRALPLAVATTLYRPFIWEAQGFLMFLNGLESLVLLYFTFKLFKRKKKMEGEKVELNEREKRLDQNSKTVVYFFLGISLTMSFFVGFTSALFGVLVRMKATTLPFFMVFLFKNIRTEKQRTVHIESSTLETAPAK